MVQISDNVIVDGWWHRARRVPSPNCNDRPAGTAVDLVVIHNISLPPGEFGGGFVEAFFLNGLDPSLHPYFATIASQRVSAHCLIDRRGRVTQFVPFHRRAWHAGRSQFQGVPECNDYGVGIELEGADDRAYSANQYQVLARLTRDLMHTYPGITPERLAGHTDIAPSRKTDPGPAFDWALYKRLMG